MQNAIEAENLTKTYDGKTNAVDGVSFSVGRGEVYGFLGPNGAGKTTIIRMLTTVASISGGSATIAGYDVKTNPAAVRRSIGVVPQMVTLDNELKGIENLLLAAKLHHLPENTSRRRANELLSLVELGGAADKRVVTYSGGMKRRLQLITALIHQPEVLFLDEPTVGLDIQTRTRIWDYIKRLNTDEGVTVFMTTHYLEEADFLSTTVAIMDHGTIRISGSPAALKEALRGDVLTIEVASGYDDLTGLMETMEGVVGVARTGSSYRHEDPERGDRASKDRHEPCHSWLEVEGHVLYKADPGPGLP